MIRCMGGEVASVLVFCLTVAPEKMSSTSLGMCRLVSHLSRHSHIAKSAGRSPNLR